MQVSNRNVADNLPSQPIARLFGHEGPITTVKFSSDGKYCVTGGYDRTIRLWNPTRIDPAYPVQNRHVFSSPQSNVQAIDSIPHALPIQSYSDGHTHFISSIDLDDTSTTLVSGSNKAMIVTDVITQKMKRRFQGHTGLINTVACASGGSIFLSGSYDGTVRIMDGRSFSTNPIQILNDAKDSITCVKVLQQNDTIAEICTTSVDGSVRTYDIRKGCLGVESFGESVALTNLDHTSDLLASAVSSLNGALYIMEKETGALINTCIGGHEAGRYSLECSVSADDQSVVCGSEDGNAAIYDFVSGKVVQKLIGHRRATVSVAAHPFRDQSDTIITASYDGDAVVWSNGMRVLSA